MSIAAPLHNPFANHDDDIRIRNECTALMTNLSRVVAHFLPQEATLGRAIRDDKRLYWLIEGFLRKRRLFEQEGKPTYVDVGYHYTDKISAIERDGLKVMGRREYFGPGIYVGNNPFAFRGYGKVGVIVLVLKGRVRWAINKNFTDSFPVHDSVAGNKAFPSKPTGEPFPSRYFDEIVLKSFDQALPILQFNRNAVANKTEFMWTLHKALVHHFIDHQFPGPPRPLGYSDPARGQPIWPTYRDIQVEHRIATECNTNLFPALQSLTAKIKESAKIRTCLDRNGTIIRGSEDVRAANLPRTNTMAPSPCRNRRGRTANKIMSSSSNCK